jgi:UDP-N-acetylmuramoyl-tripeptide--D-alanyl-D-alanine ligase
MAQSLLHARDRSTPIGRLFRWPDSNQVCASFSRLIRADFGGVVIGVTGSAGKTTTKSFLESICSGAGPTVATSGNQNNELGVPLTLARLSENPEFAGR